eukprot:CAMPEP_0184309034 /NCGR_PEP_ID=MMETSP1049-20130417/17326_1 /TAXON_ID=77928 /ORGANISM="Proteomonas sulcata, Strain CCMP704" /LENGTH=193 /DNA_ID=CAMNT_0026621845 /DNA_START=78 /DNA_END=659 /DNA_ORIENTATION=+
MSFFGITSLGPPNVFELYRHHDISAISKEDFFIAFRLIAGGKGKVSQEQMKDVLFEAAGGKTIEPQQEAEFVARFDGMSEIDIEHFEDNLDDYNAQYVTRPAKQYISSSKLREDRIKHRRCEGGSHDKYHAPLTATQEYGWGNPVDNIKRSQPPSGKMFAHRPSFMSYYAESMVCYEEGRDLCAGPTMKAMEL